MVMAAIFMLLAATLIVVGAKLVAVSQKDSLETNLYVGEAENVAKSGLVDALGYLRRNSGINPVMAYKTDNFTPAMVPTMGVNTQSGTTFTYIDQAFEPQINTTNAQISDTLEPNIGIVNEYSVDSKDNSLDANAVYFGRYEVWKQPNPFITPVAVATYTPITNAAHDITGNRSIGKSNGDGLVWNITSIGYVYKRVDKTFAAPGGPTQPPAPTPGITYFPGQWNVAYNQYPNKVVAKAVLSTEYRKLTVSLPPGNGTTVNAAVYCYQASNVNISNNFTQLSGAVSASGTYGVADMKDNSGSGNVPSGSNTPPNFQGGVTYLNGLNAGLADSQVFGMSVTNLQFLADKSGDAANPLNLQNAEWGLYYFNGNLTIGFDQPAPYTTLDTTGILVVNGDLTFTGSNGNGLLLFGGIIFCTGNVLVENGTEIDGAVIMGTPYIHGGGGTPGTVTLTGSSSNYATINFNPSLISQALNLVATYREDISARRSFLAVPNI